MVKINIAASQLAVYLRRNPYQPFTEAFFKLWSKNFKDDYQNILHEMESERNCKFMIAITEKEYVDRILSRNSISKKEQKELYFAIHNVKKSQCTKELDAGKRQIEHMINKYDITPREKAVMKRNTGSMIKTNFGQKHESVGINSICSEYNINVAGLQQSLKKQIMSLNGNQYHIQGRVDGIITHLDGDELNEPILLELKNRVNDLFYKLRDYEMVQVYAYMLMSRMESTWLMEVLKKKNDDGSDLIKNNRIIVNLNEETKQDMLDQIKEFCIFFDMFLNNRKWKEMAILAAADEEKMIWTKLDTMLNIEYSELKTKTDSNNKN